LIGETMFVLQKNRERVTGEPDRPGNRRTPEFPDTEWIGFRNQGGGHVPEDYEWLSNPKQAQEEDGSGAGPVPGTENLP
jgi:hypothetical protein